MTMDCMSELMRNSRDVTELAREVQEDEALFSLAVAREGSSALSCLREDIDTPLFDHTFGVVVEIRIEILHHREMEIVSFFESEVFV
jgi:hypothetical protein